MELVTLYTTNQRSDPSPKAYPYYIDYQGKQVLEVACQNLQISSDNLAENYHLYLIANDQPTRELDLDMSLRAQKVKTGDLILIEAIIRTIIPDLPPLPVTINLDLNEPVQDNSETSQLQIQSKDGIPKSPFDSFNSENTMLSTSSGFGTLLMRRSRLGSINPYSPAFSQFFVDPTTISANEEVAIDLHKDYDKIEGLFETTLKAKDMLKIPTYHHLSSPSAIGSYPKEASFDQVVRIAKQTLNLPDNRYSILIGNPANGKTWFDVDQTLDVFTQSGNISIYLFETDFKIEVKSPKANKLLTLNITKTVRQLNKEVSEMLEIPFNSSYCLCGGDYKTLSFDKSIPEQTEKLSNLYYRRCFQIYSGEDLDTMESTSMAYFDARDEFISSPLIKLTDKDALWFLSLQLKAEEKPENPISIENFPTVGCDRLPSNFRSKVDSNKLTTFWKSTRAIQKLDSFNAMRMFIQMARKLEGFGSLKVENISVDFPSLTSNTEVHTNISDLIVTPFCIHFYNHQTNRIEEKLLFSEIVSMTLINNSLQIEFLFKPNQSVEERTAACYILRGDNLSQIKEHIESYRSVVSDILTRRAIIEKATKSTSSHHSQNQKQPTRIPTPSLPNPTSFSFSPDDYDTISERLASGDKSEATDFLFDKSETNDADRSETTEANDNAFGESYESTFLEEILESSEGKSIETNNQLSEDDSESDITETTEATSEEQIGSAETTESAEITDQSEIGSNLYDLNFNNLHLLISNDLKHPDAAKQFKVSKFLDGLTVLKKIEEALGIKHDVNNVLLVKSVSKWTWLKPDDILMSKFIVSGSTIFLLKKFQNITLHFSDKQETTFTLDITKTVDELTSVIFKQLSFPPIRGYTFWVNNSRIGNKLVPLALNETLPVQSFTLNFDFQSTMIFKRQFFTLTQEIFMYERLALLSVLDCQEEFAKSQIEVDEKTAFYLALRYLALTVAKTPSQVDSINTDTIDLSKLIPKATKLSKNSKTKFISEIKQKHNFDTAFKCSKEYLEIISTIPKFGMKTFNITNYQEGTGKKKKVVPKALFQCYPGKWKISPDDSKKNDSTSSNYYYSIVNYSIWSDTIEITFVKSEQTDKKAKEKEKVLYDDGTISYDHSIEKCTFQSPEASTIEQVLNFNISFAKDTLRLRHKKEKEEQLKTLRKLNGGYVEQSRQNKRIVHGAMIDLKVFKNRTLARQSEIIWVDLDKNGKELGEILATQLHLSTRKDQKFCCLLQLVTNKLEWCYPTSILRDLHPQRSVPTYIYPVRKAVKIRFEDHPITEVNITIYNDIANLTFEICNQLKIPYSIGYTLKDISEGAQKVSPLDIRYSIPQQLSDTYTELCFYRRFFIFSKQEISYKEENTKPSQHQNESVTTTKKKDLKRSKSSQTELESCKAEYSLEFVYNQVRHHIITTDHDYPKASYYQLAALQLYIEQGPNPQPPTDWSKYLPPALRSKKDYKKEVLNDISSIQYINQKRTMLQYIQTARKIRVFGSEKFSVVYLNNKAKKDTTVDMFIGPSAIICDDDASQLEFHFPTLELQYDRIVNIEHYEKNISIKYINSTLTSELHYFQSEHASAIECLINQFIYANKVAIINNIQLADEPPDDPAQDPNQISDDSYKNHNTVDLYTVFNNDTYGAKTPINYDIHSSHLIQMIVKRLKLNPNSEYCLLLKLCNNEYRWIQENDIIGSFRPVTGMTLNIYSKFMLLNIHYHHKSRKIYLNISQPIGKLIPQIAFEFYVDMWNGYTLYKGDEPLDLCLTIPEQTEDFNTLTFKRRFFMMTRDDMRSDTWPLMIYKDIYKNVITGIPTLTEENIIDLAVCRLVSELGDPKAPRKLPKDLSSYLPKDQKITTDLTNKINSAFMSAPKMSLEQAIRKYISIAWNLKNFGSILFSGVYSEPGTGKDSKGNQKPIDFSIGPRGVSIFEAGSSKSLGTVPYDSIISMDVIKNQIIFQVLTDDNSIRTSTIICMSQKAEDGTGKNDLISNDVAANVISLVKQYQNYLIPQLKARLANQAVDASVAFRKDLQLCTQKSILLYTIQQRNKPHSFLYPYNLDFSKSDLVRICAYRLALPQDVSYQVFYISKKQNTTIPIVEGIQLSQVSPVEGGTLLLIEDNPLVKIISEEGILHEIPISMSQPLIGEISKITEKFNLGSEKGFTLWTTESNNNLDESPLDLLEVIPNGTSNYAALKLKRRFWIFTNEMLKDPKTLNTAFEDCMRLVMNGGISIPEETALQLAIFGIYGKQEYTEDALKEIENLSEENLFLYVPRQIESSKRVAQKLKEIIAKSIPPRPSERAKLQYIYIVTQQEGFSTEKYKITYQIDNKSNKEPLAGVLKLSLKWVEILSPNEKHSQCSFRFDSIISFKNDNGIINIFFMDEDCSHQVTINSQFSSVIYSFLNDELMLIQASDQQDEEFYISLAADDVSLDENSGFDSLVKTDNLDIIAEDHAVVFDEVNKVNAITMDTEVDAGISIDTTTTAFDPSVYASLLTDLEPQEQRLDDEEALSWRATYKGLSLERKVKVLNSAEIDINKTRKRFDYLTADQLLLHLNILRDIMNLTLVKNDPTLKQDSSSNNLKTQSHNVVTKISSSSSYFELSGNLYDKIRKSIDPAISIVQDCISLQQELTVKKDEIQQTLTALCDMFSSLKDTSNQDFEEYKEYISQQNQEQNYNTSLQSKGVIPSEIILAIVNASELIETISSSLINQLSSTFQVCNNTVDFISSLQETSNKLTALAIFFKDPSTDSRLLQFHLKKALRKSRKQIQFLNQMLRTSEEKSVSIARLMEQRNKFAFIIEKLDKIASAKQSKGQTVMTQLLYLGSHKNADTIIKGSTSLNEDLDQLIKLFSMPSTKNLTRKLTHLKESIPQAVNLIAHAKSSLSNKPIQVQAREECFYGYKLLKQVVSFTIEVATDPQLLKQLTKINMKTCSNIEQRQKDFRSIIEQGMDTIIASNISAELLSQVSSDLNSLIEKATSIPNEAFSKLTDDQIKTKKYCLETLKDQAYEIERIEQNMELNSFSAELVYNAQTSLLHIKESIPQYIIFAGMLYNCSKNNMIPVLVERLSVNIQNTLRDPVTNEDLTKISHLMVFLQLFINLQHLTCKFIHESEDENTKFKDPELTENLSKSGQILVKLILKHLNLRKSLISEPFKMSVLTESLQFLKKVKTIFTDVEKLGEKVLRVSTDSDLSIIINSLKQDIKNSKKEIRACINAISREIPSPEKIKTLELKIKSTIYSFDSIASRPEILNDDEVSSKIVNNKEIISDRSYELKKLRKSPSSKFYDISKEVFTLTEEVINLISDPKKKFFKKNDMRIIADIESLTSLKTVSLEVQTVEEPTLDIAACSIDASLQSVKELQKELKRILKDLEAGKSSKTLRELISDWIDQVSTSITAISELRVGQVSALQTKAFLIGENDVDEVSEISDKSEKSDDKSLKQKKKADEGQELFTVQIADYIKREFLDLERTFKLSREYSQLPSDVQTRLSKIVSKTATSVRSSITCIRQLPISQKPKLSYDAFVKIQEDTDINKGTLIIANQITELSDLIKKYKLLHDMQKRKFTIQLMDDIIDGLSNGRVKLLRNGRESEFKPVLSSFKQVVPDTVTKINVVQPILEDPRLGECAQILSSNVSLLVKIMNQPHMDDILANSFINAASPLAISFKDLLTANVTEKGSIDLYEKSKSIIVLLNQLDDSAEANSQEPEEVEEVVIQAPSSKQDKISGFATVRQTKSRKFDNISFNTDIQSSGKGEESLETGSGTLKQTKTRPRTGSTRHKHHINTNSVEEFNSNKGNDSKKVEFKDTNSQEKERQHVKKPLTRGFSTFEEMKKDNTKKHHHHHKKKCDSLILSPRQCQILCDDLYTNMSDLLPMLMITSSLDDVTAKGEELYEVTKKFTRLPKKDLKLTGSITVSTQPIPPDTLSFTIKEIIQKFTDNLPISDEIFSVLYEQLNKIQNCQESIPLYLRKASEAIKAGLDMHKETTILQAARILTMFLPNHMELSETLCSLAIRCAIKAATILDGLQNNLKFLDNMKDNEDDTKYYLEATHRALKNTDFSLLMQVQTLGTVVFNLNRMQICRNQILLLANTIEKNVSIHQSLKQLAGPIVDSSHEYSAWLLECEMTLQALFLSQMDEIAISVEALQPLLNNVVVFEGGIAKIIRKWVKLLSSPERGIATNYSSLSGASKSYLEFNSNMKDKILTANISTSSTTGSSTPQISSSTNINADEIKDQINNTTPYFSKVLTLVKKWAGPSPLTNTNIKTTSIEAENSFLLSSVLSASSALQQVSNSLASIPKASALLISPVFTQISSAYLKIEQIVETAQPDLEGSNDLTGSRLFLSLYNDTGSSVNLVDENGNPSNSEVADDSILNQGGVIDNTESNISLLKQSNQSLLSLAKQITLKIYSALMKNPCFTDDKPDRYQKKIAQLNHFLNKFMNKLSVVSRQKISEGFSTIEVSEENDLDFFSDLVDQQSLLLVKATSQQIELLKKKLDQFEKDKEQESTTKESTEKEANDRNLSTPYAYRSKTISLDAERDQKINILRFNPKNISLVDKMDIRYFPLNDSYTTLLRINTTNVINATIFVTMVSAMQTVNNDAFITLARILLAERLQTLQQQQLTDFPDVLKIFNKHSVSISNDSILTPEFFLGLESNNETLSEIASGKIISQLELLNDFTTLRQFQSDLNLQDITIQQLIIGRAIFNLIKLDCPIDTSLFIENMKPKRDLFFSRIMSYLIEIPKSIQSNKDYINVSYAKANLLIVKANLYIQLLQSMLSISSLLIQNNSHIRKYACSPEGQSMLTAPFTSEEILKQQQFFNSQLELVEHPALLKAYQLNLSNDDIILQSRIIQNHIVNLCSSTGFSMIMNNSVPATFNGLMSTLNIIQQEASKANPNILQSDSLTGDTAIRNRSFTFIFRALIRISLAQNFYVIYSALSAKLALAEKCMKSPSSSSDLLDIPHNIELITKHLTMLNDISKLSSELFNLSQEDTCNEANFLLVAIALCFNPEITFDKLDKAQTSANNKSSNNELSENQLSGNENKLSGNENKLSGNENGLSGNENKLSGNENKLSGNENKLSGNENKLSGNENKSFENENKLSGSDNILSGNDNKSSGNESSLSENDNILSGNESSLSGNENKLSGSENKLSGNDDGRSENKENEINTKAENETKTTGTETNNTSSPIDDKENAETMKEDTTEDTTIDELSMTTLYEQILIKGGEIKDVQTPTNTISDLVLNTPLSDIHAIASFSLKTIEHAQRLFGTACFIQMNRPTLLSMPIKEPKLITAGLTCTTIENARAIMQHLMDLQMSNFKEAETFFSRLNPMNALPTAFCALGQMKTLIENLKTKAPFRELHVQSTLFDKVCLIQRIPKSNIVGNPPILPLSPPSKEAIYMQLVYIRRAVISSSIRLMLTKLMGQRIYARPELVKQINTQFTHDVIFNSNTINSTGEEFVNMLWGLKLRSIESMQTSIVEQLQEMVETGSISENTMKDLDVNMILIQQMMIQHLIDIVTQPSQLELDISALTRQIEALKGAQIAARLIQKRVALHSQPFPQTVPPSAIIRLSSNKKKLCDIMDSLRFQMNHVEDYNQIKRVIETLSEQDLIAQQALLHMFCALPETSALIGYLGVELSGELDIITNDNSNNLQASPGRTKIINGMIDYLSRSIGQKISLPKEPIKLTDGDAIQQKLVRSIAFRSAHLQFMNLMMYHEIFSPDLKLMKSLRTSTSYTTAASLEEKQLAKCFDSLDTQIDTAIRFSEPVTLRNALLQFKPKGRYIQQAILHYAGNHTMDTTAQEAIMNRTKLDFDSPKTVGTIMKSILNIAKVFIKSDPDGFLDLEMPHQEEPLKVIETYGAHIEIDCRDDRAIFNIIKSLIKHQLEIFKKESSLSTLFSKIRPILPEKIFFSVESDTEYVERLKLGCSLTSLQMLQFSNNPKFTEYLKSESAREACKAPYSPAEIANEQDMILSELIVDGNLLDYKKLHENESEARTLREFILVSDMISRVIPLQSANSPTRRLFSLIKLKVDSTQALLDIGPVTINQLSLEDGLKLAIESAQKLQALIPNTATLMPFESHSMLAASSREALPIVQELFNHQGTVYPAACSRLFAVLPQLIASYAKLQTSTLSSPNVKQYLPENPISILKEAETLIDAATQLESANKREIFRQTVSDLLLQIQFIVSATIPPSADSSEQELELFSQFVKALRGDNVADLFFVLIQFDALKVKEASFGSSSMDKSASLSKIEKQLSQLRPYIENTFIKGKSLDKDKASERRQQLQSLRSEFIQALSTFIKNPIDIKPPSIAELSETINHHKAILESSSNRLVANVQKPQSKLLNATSFLSQQIIRSISDSFIVFIKSLLCLSEGNSLFTVSSDSHDHKSKDKPPEIPKPHETHEDSDELLSQMRPDLFVEILSLYTSTTSTLNNFSKRVMQQNGANGVASIEIERTTRSLQRLLSRICDMVLDISIDDENIDLGRSGDRSSAVFTSSTIFKGSRLSHILAQKNWRGKSLNDGFNEHGEMKPLEREMRQFLRSLVVVAMITLAVESAKCVARVPENFKSFTKVTIELLSKAHEDLRLHRSRIHALNTDAGAQLEFDQNSEALFELLQKFANGSTSRNAFAEFDVLSVIVLIAKASSKVLSSLFRLTDAVIRNPDFENAARISAGSTFVAASPDSGFSPELTQSDIDRAEDLAKNFQHSLSEFMDILHQSEQHNDNGTEEEEEAPQGPPANPLALDSALAGAFLELKPHALGLLSEAGRLKSSTLSYSLERDLSKFTAVFSELMESFQRALKNRFLLIGDWTAESTPVLSDLQKLSGGFLDLARKVWEGSQHDRRSQAPNTKALKALQTSLLNLRLFLEGGVIEQTDAAGRSKEEFTITEETISKAGKKSLEITAELAGTVFKAGLLAKEKSGSFTSPDTMFKFVAEVNRLIVGVLDEAKALSRANIPDKEAKGVELAERILRSCAPFIKSYPRSTEDDRVIKARVSAAALAAENLSKDYQAMKLGIKTGSSGLTETIKINLLKRLELESRVEKAKCLLEHSTKLLSKL